MEGFCEEDVHPFGPVQLYDALLIKFELSDKVCPAVIGELDPAETEGTEATDTYIEPHPDDQVEVELSLALI